MATLYVMCGIPGSGKSTFIRTHINKQQQVWVSRDVIRYRMVDEEESYFSREDEVWEEFIRQINAFLQDGYDVFADATHINQGSRRKLLNEIYVECKKEVVYINTPVSLCLERNLDREGRECVPSKVIHRMYHQFEEPSFEEGFSTIYIVKPNEKIKIWRKDNG